MYACTSTGIEAWTDMGSPRLARTKPWRWASPCPWHAAYLDSSPRSAYHRTGTPARTSKKPEPGASAVEKQAERGKGHGLMVCTDRGEVSEAGLGSRLRLGKMHPLGGWCDGIFPLLLARLPLPRELAVVPSNGSIQGHVIDTLMYKYSWYGTGASLEKIGDQ